MIHDALASIEIDLYRNGKIVDSGRSSDVLGGPHYALEHLTRTLAEMPTAPPLTQGEIITTGTLTDPQIISPGESWSLVSRGLGLQGFSVAF